MAKIYRVVRYVVGCTTYLNVMVKYEDVLLREYIRGAVEESQTLREVDFQKMFRNFLRRQLKKTTDDLGQHFAKKLNELLPDEIKKKIEAAQVVGLDDTLRSWVQEREVLLNRKLTQKEKQAASDAAAVVYSRALESGRDDAVSKKIMKDFLRTYDVKKPGT